MRSRFGRKVSILVLMLFALSILAGCGGQAGQNKASKDSDTIKVGVNCELSGVVASYGDNARNGALIAIEEINKAGGVLGKQLEPVVRDNQSKTDEAMNVSAALVDEGVVAQIGPLTSGTVAGSTPVMMENQICLIAPAATANNVTVDEKTNKTRDYIFRVCYRDSDQGERMADFAIDTLKVKKAAIFGSTSDDYAKGLAKYFKKEFEAKGGTIVAEEGFMNLDKEFRGTLTKIRSKNPDFIYAPGYYTEVSVLIKQARELGLDVPIGGGDGWDSPDLVKVAGVEALNNTFFTNHYSVEDPDPAIQSFVKAYQEHHKKLPDSFAALGYDSVKLLADAITRAESADPAKIKEALENTKDFAGITGTMSINEQHNPVKNIVIIEYKDGKLVSR